MAGSDSKLQTLRLSTSPAPEALRGLEIGSVVYLDGVVYTGREGVYKRVVEEDGEHFRVKKIGEEGSH